MTNEHNPVAVRINHIQQKWKNKVQGRKYKVVRLSLTNEDDLPLVNGFYKWESSVHRTIDEVLVVLLTDFETADNYSYQLAKDWINEYEKSLDKIPDLPWIDFPVYKEKVLKANSQQPQGHLLIEMLTSYQHYIPEQPQKLRIGIVPRKVHSYKDFAIWLDKLALQLPQNIGIVLTDYSQDSYYSRLMKNPDYSGCTLLIEDQNMKGAYEELIKGGNPNDPQVKFRTCMLEMGKEASLRNSKGVHHWGERILDIGQSTGQKEVWASAHLIYAGFLFGFKDSKIHGLLDRGMQICSSLQGSQASSALGIQLQLYNYKASYYSIEGHPQKAWEWFIKSTSQAVKNQQYGEAVSSCKNAIILAEKNFMKSDMMRYMEAECFNELYQQEDDFIKATEFSFLANYYLSHSSRISKEEYQRIDERMIRLYGKQWRHRAFSKLEVSPQVSIN
ncbi:hypothetical protein [Apibacter sp. HY039]|uniref:hypothetical protein n=1 Tax=Apibacter sp. HY039 TaxID=2501476 RepID=UPI000FEB9937|nr:hypothetical protein [Apibacter sp. HY039]